VSLQANATSVASGYQLGTGDKLRVTVFGEQALSGEFEVDSTGVASLPLVGQVKAAGMTPRQFEEALTATFKNGGYLRDPKVSVEVLNYRPYYILGEVQKPGEYPYKNGLNVMSAVATAGGFTYRASPGTVEIQRAGEVKGKRYPLTTTVPVFPGDIVRIPERYF
jgi:polysaccharide biosynthesis/export protein